jgi:hypothetical protein
MKTLKLVLAIATFAAAMPLAPAVANDRPAAWLVAQTDRVERTCDLDGRKVPVGTMYCREGKVQQCTPQGGWINTNKPC